MYRFSNEGCRRHVHHWNLFCYCSNLNQHHQIMYSQIPSVALDYISERGLKNNDKRDLMKILKQ